VSIAVVATVVSYVGLLIDQGGAIPWVLEWQWTLWVAPPVLAVLLGLVPRTRSLAAGLGLGLAVTWIVGVPTCVVVSLSTVPYL
jgi:Na+-translocating ferredoxin:NAD+ oxidoreductase RnfE subunit